MKASCLVSWAFCCSSFFFFFFSFFRIMHVCMGLDVWVNVFTMPFLCADSGPWRKMSRAWPPMSAIMTSSASTCPSHQESAWRAAEARQEIKGYCRRGYKWHCWHAILEYLLNTPTKVFCQYCRRQEGLRCVALLRSICRATWPSPTTSVDRKRTSKWKHHVWWVEHFVILLLFFIFFIFYFILF